MAADADIRYQYHSFSSSDLAHCLFPLFFFFFFFLFFCYGFGLFVQDLYFNQDTVEIILSSIDALSLGRLGFLPACLLFVCFSGLL
jgi:hypothetical protein